MHLIVFICTAFCIGYAPSYWSSHWFCVFVLHICSSCRMYAMVPADYDRSVSRKSNSALCFFPKGQSHNLQKTHPTECCVNFATSLWLWASNRHIQMYCRSCFPLHLTVCLNFMCILFIKTEKGKGMDAIENDSHSPLLFFLIVIHSQLVKCSFSNQNYAGLGKKRQRQWKTKQIGIPSA